MLGNFLDRWFSTYSRLDRKVGLLPGYVWKLRSKYSKDFRESRNLERFRFMNNQPTKNPFIESKESLPNIELVILSKESDFKMLPLVLRFALDNTINPVGAIRVVIPDSDLVSIKNFNLKLSSNEKKMISIHLDSQYISAANTERIQQSLPNRFGWITQQVVANVAIQQSQHANVLLVDADTLLLRKQAWLSGEGNQILMPSEEYHTPYYDFLSFAYPLYSHTGISFVSHHMLYQVDIFREIMEHLGGIDRLLARAIECAPVGEQSPFDLKYEPYAQYMYLHLRDKIKLQKWANISLQRWSNYEDPDSVRQLQRLSKFYNSVSFHHWNSRKRS